MDLSCTSLTDLTITASNIPNLQLPPSIRRLHFEIYMITPAQSTSCTESFPALDKLESLYFGVEEAFSYPDFLLQAAEKTKSGRLIQCTLSEAVDDMLPQFPRLLETEWLNSVESLTLGFSQINDSNSLRFVSALPNLKKLHIHHTDGITGTFVKALISAPASKIKRVRIVNCGGVKQDIVGWAKAHGVVMVLDNDSIYDDE